MSECARAASSAVAVCVSAARAVWLHSALRRQPKGLRDRITTSQPGKKRKKGKASRHRLGIAHSFYFYSHTVNIFPFLLKRGHPGGVHFTEDVRFVELAAPFPWLCFD